MNQGLGEPELLPVPKKITSDTSEGIEFLRFLSSVAAANDTRATNGTKSDIVPVLKVKRRQC